MKLFQSIKKKTQYAFLLLAPEQKIKFFLIFIFIFFGVFLEVLSLTSVLPLVSALTSGDNFIHQFIKENHKTFDLFFLNSLNAIYWTSILFFILFFFKNVYLFLLSNYQAKFLSEVTADLRAKVYGKFINQSILSIVQKNSYSFINDMIHNCNIYANTFVYSIFSLLLEALVFFIFLCILFYHDPQSTILVFLVFGLITVLVLRYNKYRVLKYSNVLHNENLLLFKNIQHTYAGIRDIKIFGKEIFFKKLIQENISKINYATYKAGVIALYPKYLLEIIAIFFILFFFNLNIKLENGLLKISPFLFLFAAAIFRLLPSLSKVIMLINKLRHTITPVKTLINSINSLEVNQDNKQQHIKNLKLPKLINIHFKHVSFFYPGAKHSCFENINLKFTDNNLVGLCGRSGAGKTTLLDILMGLKTPSQGEILINNYSLENIKMNWQLLIGYVQQEVFMLNDSIINNIAFGVPRHKINLTLVNQVVKDVNLKEFISSLANGLETNIGERGSKISGGQKQKIAIARALYRNPRIIIFDEATNGLDAKSELEILSLLHKLKKKVLIMFISHKFSILKNCDVVYELKNRKIYKK
jgi:ATP-binding cassette, subfamily B, bacterial PglK